jgi:hypothetical protein
VITEKQMDEGLDVLEEALASVCEKKVLAETVAR